MASTDDVPRRREELERCPPGHDGRYLALFDLAKALYGRFKKDGKIDDLNGAIALHRNALELRPVGWARSLSLHDLAVCFAKRYIELGAADDLEEAIVIAREALELRPPGYVGRDLSLHNLGTYLWTRFATKAEHCDLEEAINMLRATLELHTPGHLDRSSTLRFLVLCLSNRYENQRSVKDLEELVTLRRAQLELCPRGNANHVECLHNLACDLRTRFTETAEIRDLEESIALHHAALVQCPSGHPARSSTLYELALCLSNRHDKLGEADNLEEAVKLGYEALALRPSTHPDHDATLHNLACDLRRMFAKTEAIHYLEESIQLHVAALERRPPGHPARSLTLHELALCLSIRHDKHGVADDLEEAIKLGREALELSPSGHADRLQIFLARGLRKRFLQNTATGDLEESIALLRPALELCPIGHPDRSSALHELALCLSHRHDEHGVANDLKEAILHGRAALKFCPPGHPDRGIILYSHACDLWKKFQFRNQAASVVRLISRVDLASSLFDLSRRLWDRFRKHLMVTNLDSAICLATHALELRLPPEDVSVTGWVQRLSSGANSDEFFMPGRAVDNLCALANYHRARFQTLHDIVDLNEAITFYRHTLQFCPSGHPNRASSIHDLAQSLADRFRKQSTAADLDEAIALQQEALQLLGRGGAGYDISRRSLATYVQMRIRTQTAMMSSGVSGTVHFDVEQVIRNTIFETLKTMPTRLLHTHTGILCNRDAQVSHFLSSQQYSKLVSLCKTCDRIQQMELIHTEVSRYFQYVMLSHRWGTGEPSLHDVEGQKVYNMPVIGSFGKLQGFCAMACEWDYLWAWSDTCCIDQHSSAELQESIGSMFAWYRQSALTIIYLSDVPDTGSLGSSEWLTRGWTLQELLAP
ncbi:hypothetical protein EDD17DRAFT_1771229 [Pisolithus thermaeus]|nr:hypothetical protein EDD17DRAFT_1771229 [Pisolithus thermaeus]